MLRGEEVKPRRQKEEDHLQVYRFVPTQEPLPFEDQHKEGEQNRGGQKPHDHHVRAGKPHLIQQLAKGAHGRVEHSLHDRNEIADRAAAGPALLHAYAHAPLGSAVPMLPDAYGSRGFAWSTVSETVSASDVQRRRS